MSFEPTREALDSISDDLRNIREHMKDHDLLIEACTVLRNLSSQINNMEKNAILKADGKDMDALERRIVEAAMKLENRIIYNTGDIKEMRAYMYRMMGIAAAVQVFIGIFLGLISFFHH